MFYINIKLLELIEKPKLQKNYLLKIFRHSCRRYERFFPPIILCAISRALKLSFVHLMSIAPEVVQGAVGRWEGRGKDEAPPSRQCTPWSPESRRHGTSRVRGQKVVERV